MLERGQQDSVRLLTRLSEVQSAEIQTTIVTYEEQMRGWLAFAAQSNSLQKTVIAYERLQTHIAVFRNVPLLPFDAIAADIYAELRKSRIRIGVMDLRIASIALAYDATVISRNLRDFSLVPGLRVEDWAQ